MYANWTANAMVVLATIATVSVCVLVHYEGLVALARGLGKVGELQRVKVLYAILGVIGLHVVQIWIFGMTLWLLLKWPDCGSIHGADTLHIFDYVYFSAATFSTVGFGDLAPVGPIRFLAGTEALTGFVLIAWSASFTYLEMERFWRSR